MNILVIPEDFRKDQYMLKPIIIAMMEALGKPKTKVRVCQDPLLRGVSEWQVIRNETNPKETYFLPYAQQRNVLDTPSEGNLCF